MESLLITGSNGFVGKYLVSHLKKTFRVFQTDIDIITKLSCEDHVFMDITDTNLVNQVISKCNPDIILHLAANKNVGFCEVNKDEVRRVNVNGTRNILNACAEYNIFLIFMSSDYVFEGTTGMYAEENIRCPSTVYGKMKKEAEDLVMGYGIEYCICRSGGIYAYADWQNPLLNWASERLKKGQSIDAFTNLYNTPTCIYDLIMGIELIAKEHKEGIFHITGSQRTNRWEFLREFALSYGYNPDLVLKKEYKHQISLDSYKRPEDLSLNSLLSERKLEMRFFGIREGFEQIKVNQMTTLD